MLKILIHTRVALVQGCGCLEEFEVYWETDLLIDSRENSESICAIYWGAITGLLRCFHILDKDVMHKYVLACNCLSFVEKEIIFSTLMPL